MLGSPLKQTSSASNEAMTHLSQNATTTSSAEDTPPLKRLMITKIVLENFKSYAGIQEVGPFHKCFSSVVGPNGSGKSNVIDALMFVTGKRAKAIRQRKLSELIHNSTEHPNLDSCKVSVHFQDIIDLPNGEFDVVPNSKMVMSRTALRNNTSSYYMDGKLVTYTVCTETLKARGIDLVHNRFLILQGEVQAISMKPPKAKTEHDEGMLEYLEDIIGTDRFKAQISECSEVLETLQEQRTEKLNRVKAVEKEKDGLEGPKNEALEFRDKTNELTCKKAVLFQLYAHQQAKLYDENCIAMEEAAAEVEARTSGEIEAAKEVEKLSQQHKKVVKESSKLAKVLDTAKEEFAAFERKDIKFQEDQKHAKNQIKKLAKAVEKETKTLATQRAALKRNEEDSERLTAELPNIKARLEVADEELQRILESLKDETAGLQAEVESMEQQLIPLRKTSADAQGRLDVEESELRMLRSKFTDASKALSHAKMTLSSATESVHARSVEAETLRTRQPACMSELRAAELTLASLTKEESVVVAASRVSRAKVQESKVHLASAQSKGRLIDELMKLKKSNQMPGIHGRLGDLGTIDAQYDVAISTACSSLNHVVVDTTDTAQAAVEHLRKHNLGRTTFVILDRLNHLQAEADRPFHSSSANAPRLFDLIQPKDESYRLAFFKGVRDTVVAGDLEQASRLAYGGPRRLRVVTLTGQLIDTSGTMAGGGNKVASGGMRAQIIDDSISEEEVQMLEKAARESEEAVKTHISQTSELQRRVKALNNEAADIETRLHKCTAEIDASSDYRAELEQQIKDLAATSTPTEEDNSQMRELEIAVEASKAELNEARSHCIKSESAVEQLQAQIMAAGGTRLRAQKSKVDSVKDELATTNSDITKAGVNAKTAAKAVDKSLKALENSSLLSEKANENLKILREEHSSFEAKAEKVLSARNEAQIVLEEKQDEAASINKELTERKEALEKLKLTNVESVSRLEDLRRAVHENEMRIRSWKKKLAALSLDITDDTNDDDSSGDDSDEVEEEENLDLVDMEINDGEDDNLRSNKRTSNKTARRHQRTVVSREIVPLSSDKLQEVVEKDILYDISVLEDRLSSMQPNMSAIADYRRKDEQYLAAVKVLEAVTADRDAKRSMLDDVRKQRLDEFMAGFSTITLKLKEMYQMITLGGDAELELVDSLDPFSEGIVFSVRPPKKSWKNIANLSGGEQTLSSLALVFALHHYRPTPLYVMDEIDAALDFKNVSIVANYIKERTRNAQFIIISLRNNMFELADRLVGIYKTHNATKSVTINPHQMTVS